MASRRRRATRRDRRKAKQTGWRRAPKGRKVGHGTSLTDTITPSESESRSIQRAYIRKLRKTECKTE